MKKRILIFGGALIDSYYILDAYPERGQDGYILEQFDVVGGCAVNMAYTVKVLGGTASVVSAVGNDEKGNMIRKYFHDHQLDLQCVKVVPGKTGYCMVFVEKDGERTFLTAKGCEGSFFEELIDQSFLEETSVAAVTGYYLLEKDTDSVVNYLEFLKSRGCKIIFDPSPLVDKINKNALKRILAICDIVTPNRTEAEVLRNVDAIGNNTFNNHEEPFGQISSFVDQWAENFCKGKKTVVLKDGKRGGTVFSPEKKFSYPAEIVEAVDTTGAGDSFAGALAWALTENMPIEKMVALAAKCAAEVTKIKGPHGHFKLEGERNE